MRRSALGAIGVLCCLERAASAQAPEPDHARLDYTSPPPYSTEQSFRHRIAAGLGGIDPFVGDAPIVVHVKILRQGPRRFVAQVSADDAGGHHPHRDLIEPECSALIEDLAIVVVGWLKPLAPDPRPPECSQSAPKAVECLQPATPTVPRWPEDLGPVEIPLPPPRVTVVPPEREQGLQFRVGVAGWLSAITTDRGSPGVAVDAGVRYRWFSTSAEVRFDPPTGAAPISANLSLDYLRVTGALLPCAEYQWVYGCLKAEFGRFFFTGTSAISVPLTYTAMGLRLGVAFPVIPQRLAFRVMGEVVEAVDPASVTHLTKTTTTIFQVTRTNGGGGLSLLLMFDKP